MPIEPKLISVEKACQMIGIGRTKLYQLLGTECLITVKIGRRRLITVASLDRFISNSAELNQGRSAGGSALYSHVGQPIRPIDAHLAGGEGTDAGIGRAIFSRHETDGEK